MGSWDYYCALCGAGFTFWGVLPPKEKFKVIRKMIEEGGMYDLTDRGEMNPIICSYESLDWLNHLRLLGQNPHGKVGRGAFLTGLGDSEDYGGANVEPGDDPNVLREDGRDIQEHYAYNDGRLSISTYTNWTSNDKYDLPLPVHDRCVQMLRRVVSGTPDGEISLDTLYDALGTKRGGKGNKTDPRPFRGGSLFLNYYQLSIAAREQFWGSNPGLEPWYNDPVSIPAIPQFLTSLPRAAPPSAEKASDPTSDPFARLPLELLHEVFLHLPKESLLPFFLSSRAARLASLSKWAWKKRMLLDMPWLWEFEERKEWREDVDWQNVYARMFHASFQGMWKGIEIDGCITEEQRLDLDLSGLASRRRIWNCCGQVRDLYEEQLRKETPEMQ